MMYDNNYILSCGVKTRAKKNDKRETLDGKGKQEKKKDLLSKMEEVISLGSPKGDVFVFDI